MKLTLFLLGNMIKQACKGDWHEAWDAWCWLSFHVWYAARGKVKRIERNR